MFSRDVIKRYMIASLEGRLPPCPVVKTLPPDKDEFPKLLALDCNKWIALGRSHYKRTNADPSTGVALDAIRAGTESGRLVVAFHFMNALEAAKGEQPERRERLASFMVDLSENHCFRPTPMIAADEKRAAVRTAYLGLPAESVRPGVVGYGLDDVMMPLSSPEAISMVGLVGELGFAGAFAAMRAAPETTVYFIADAMRRNEAMPRDAERERAGAARIQQSRDADAALTEDQRARLELSNLWDHSTTDAVREALKEFVADVDGFRAWLAEGANLFAFWRAVPTIWTLHKIEMKAGRNQQRRIADNVNDVRDVSFYKSALPYANVLVTENHWASTIRNSKLDREWGTTILTRLDELPAE